MTVLLKQLYRVKKVAKRKSARILNFNSVYPAAIGKTPYFMQCSIREGYSLYWYHLLYFSAATTFTIEHDMIFHFLVWRWLS